MIILKAINDSELGFEIEIHVDGEKRFIVQQLAALFNSVYSREPKLFEEALLNSQYTIDHT